MFSAYSPPTTNGAFCGSRTDQGAQETTMPGRPDPAPKKKEMLRRLLQGKLSPAWPDSSAQETPLAAADVSPSKNLHGHRVQ